MKASFGVDIKGLKKPSSVWMDDATYKDVSGKATFNQKETELVTSILSRTGKTFRKINSTINKFSQVTQTVSLGHLAIASLKTYNNSRFVLERQLKINELMQRLCEKG